MTGTAVPLIGVLAVDDDATYRRVVARIVAATPGFRCVGEAASVIEQGPGRVAVVLMSSDPRLLAPEGLPHGTAGTISKERLSPGALRALWAG